MAKRFLSNINVNDQYTLPSADGTSGQVIQTDGSGNLSFVDFASDEARKIVFTVKNKDSISLSKGTVVHASPSATPPSGNVIEVIRADNDDSSKMPAIGVLNETLAVDAEGECVMLGSVSGIATNSFSIGDELYVSDTPGEFTNTKPTGTSNLIQKIAIVIKSHSTNGLIEVFGAGRSNDVPNQIDRTITFSANQKFTDNSLILLGSGDMFQIGHKVNYSQIATYEGHLYIDNNATDQDIIFRSDDGSGGLANYITIDGSATTTVFNKNTRHEDSVLLQVGSSNDAAFYHNGTDTFLTNSTGDLKIRQFANDKDIIFESDDGAGGVATYFYLDGSLELNKFVKNVRLDDNIELQLGTNGDLRLEHTGTNGTITNYTGDLTIDSQGDDLILKAADDALLYVQGSDIAIQAVGDGKVGLRYDNVEKLATTSTGAKVTGEIVVDGTTSAFANSGITLKRTGVLTGDADILLAGVSGSEALAFRVNDSEKVRIQDNGNVGIGLASPSYPLEIANNASTSFVYQRTGVSANKWGFHSDNDATYWQNVTTGNLLFTLQNGGNVGIGTTSPSYKLDVEHNSNATNGIQVTNTNSGTSSRATVEFVSQDAQLNIYATSSNYNDVASWANAGVLSTSGATSNGLIFNTQSGGIKFQYGTSEKMRIDSSGNVGIGTDSAVTRLSVSSSGAEGISLTQDTTTTSNSGRLFFETDTASEGFSFLNSNGIMTIRSNAQAGVTSGNTKVAITTAGDVGINTTSPQAKLEVITTRTGSPTSDTNIKVTDNTAQAADVGGSINFTGKYTDAGDYLSGSPFIRASKKNSTTGDYGYGLKFGVRATGSGNNNVAMTIDSDSNVGIGTDSPDRQLQVHESTSGTSAAKFTNSTTGEDGDTGFLVGINSSEQPILFGYNSTDMVIGTNGAERMRIDSSGNVGIGTTSPSQKLHVAGNIRVTGAYYDSNNSSGTADQVLVSTGTGTDWQDLSDISGVDGTGTANYVAMWSDTDTITDAPITISGNNATFAGNVTTGGQVTVPSGYSVNIGTSRIHSTDTSYLLGGNTGIGTSTPNGKLTIKDSGFGTAYNDYDALYIDNGSITAGNGNYGNGIGFSRLGSATYKKAAIIPVQGTSDEDNLGLAFFTSPNSGFADVVEEAMRINYNGFVGIGTDSPVQKLHVHNSTASSASYAKFSNAQTGTTTADGFDIGVNTSDQAIVWQRENTNLLFGTNNTERMRIDNSGNVHLATGRLRIASGSDEGSQLNLWADSNGFCFIAGYDLEIKTGNNNARSTRVKIKHTGEVGIGTTSPSQPLQILGAGNYDPTSSGGQTTNGILIRGGGTVGDNTYTAGIGFAHGNGTSGISGLQTDGADQDRMGLAFFTHASGTGTVASSEAMRIEANGNVGIGDTTPSEKLEVFGNIRLSDGTQRNIIGPTNQTLGIFASPNSSTEGIKFSTDGGTTTEMFIQDGGNVGIGTSSPSTKLETVGIIKSSGNGASFMFEDRVNSGNNWEWFSAYNKAGLYKNHNTAETVMTIDSSGNVGIGTDAPDGIFKAVSGTSPNAAQILIGYNSTSENYFDANTQIFRNGSYVERMRIASSGRTTITGSAGYLFDIQTTDTNQPRLQVYVDDTSGVSLISGYNTTPKSMLFYTGGSERMRIDTSGNTTFTGRTDLQKDLRIRGNDASGSLGVVRFSTDANNQLIIDTGNDGSNRTIIDGSGNATFAGNVLPSVDSTYDLGSTSLYWRNLYADNIISNGGDAEFQKVYKDTVTINNSTYTTIATVGGDSLASGVRLNVTGTSGSVVINVDAKILVQHSRDILIQSTSGYYRRIFIKVVSDNNEDFAIELKRDTAGSTSTTNVNVEIIPLSTEVITFTSSHSFTGQSHEHVTEYGQSQSSIDGDNANDFHFWLKDDGAKLKLGAGEDLQIYHDGSNSYIEDTGTGSLVVQSSDLFLRTNSTENAIVCAANSSVSLYHNNSLRFETISDGVRVPDNYDINLFNSDITNSTGQINLSRSGAITFYGNSGYEHSITSRDAAFNASDDLRINSFAAVYINLDSNNNNGSSADFRIGRHGGTSTISDWLFKVDGETGNVGIGTTSPSQKLDVNGYARATSGFVGNNGLSLFGDNSSTNRVFVSTDGSVGIGTTSPVAGLQINGGTTNTSNRSDVALFTGSNVGGLVNALGLINGATATFGNAVGLNFHNASSYSPTGAIRVYQASSGTITDASMRFYTYQGSLTEKMRITSGGNVGIGTDSPDFELDVAGNIGIDDKIYHNGDHNTYIGFTGDTQTFRTGGSDRVTINNTGVGIGTTSPGKKLEVNGSFKLGTNAYIEYGGVYPYTISTLNTAAVGNLIFTAGSGSSGYESGITLQGSNTGADDAITFTTGSSTAMVIQVDGNVGIGTSSPSTVLDVRNSINIGGAGQDSNIYFQQNTSNQARINYYTDNSMYFDNWSGGYYFRTTSSFTPRVTILNGGNVGIGTTSPEEKLHVAGNLKVEGGIVVQNTTSHGSVLLPEGAYYHSTTSSVTGAIKITLPVHGTADMLSFVVDIYDYTTNESITAYIKGYLYQQTGSNEWVNLSVQIIASDKSRNYTVRFGADGSNSCVWIGETNSTWTYPQVQVRDFTSGFNTNIDSFTDGWDVSFVTSFDTVDETVTNTFPISKEVENSNIRITNSGSSYLNGGNVGIGETNPSRKLHIKNINDTRGILIENTLSTSYAEVHLKASREFRVGTGNSSSATEARDRFYVYDATAGAHRFTIDSSGNVGIGTTSPSAPLDVNGNVYVRGTGSLYVDTLAGYTSGVITLNSSTNFIVPSGSVGIGTTSPGAKLDIGLGTLANNGLGGIRITDDAAHFWMLIRKNSVGDRRLSIYHGQGSIPLVFQEGGGNVGIGTTAPSEKLQVDGNIRIAGVGSAIGFDTTGALLSNGIKTINDYETLIYNGRGSAGFAVIGNSNIRLGFGSNYSAAETDLFIASTGNVGIGETSPSEKLDVDGNIRLRTGVLSSNNGTISHSTNNLLYVYGGSSGLYLSDNTGQQNSILIHDTNYIDFNTAATRRLRIDSSGRMLVGLSGSGNIYVGGSTTGQYFRIHHNNSDTYLDGNGGKIYFRGDSGANTRFEMDMTGTDAGKFIASGDIVAFGSPSDKTLKENIRPIENALDKVNKLEGVEFNWKEQGITNLNEDIGFIAQDVQKVLPQLVRENENGKLSLRHQGIVPVLVEAIKELKQEIETLKSQINK